MNNSIHYILFYGFKYCFLTLTIFAQSAGTVEYTDCTSAEE